MADGLFGPNIISISSIK